MGAISIGGAERDRTVHASLRSGGRDPSNFSGGGRTAPPEPPTEVATSIPEGLSFCLSLSNR